jgi:hypothetical protein
MFRYHKVMQAIFFILTLATISCTITSLCLGYGNWAFYYGIVSVGSMIIYMIHR